VKIKNYFFLTAIFCFCHFALHAQKAALVQTRNGWGYLRMDSTWLISPQFENLELNKLTFEAVTPKSSIGSFSEGMARYSNRSFWGYYNDRGELCIPEKFHGARDFSDSLAAVKKINKWGYINKKGEWIIQPQYTDADNFSSGFAPVKIGKRWGYILPQ
jgi:hypothetical protein